MNSKDKSFVVGGLIIAIIIAILAPFLGFIRSRWIGKCCGKTTSNPEPEPLFESPLPDYAVPALGESPLGGVVSIVLGTLVAFLAMVGLATVARWFKSENGSSS